MEERKLKGYRIWKINEKTKIPREIKEGNNKGFYELDLSELDLDNKTYAIRIGKEGLK